MGSCQYKTNSMVNLFNMKKLDIIFNLPITLMAILLVRLVTNKYQSSSTNILTQSQIDSYRKNGILIMDWQIFPADKLEEISTILISKVKSISHGTKTETAAETIHPHLKDRKI